MIQKETVDFCKERNILIEAWMPLVRGKALTHPTLISITTPRYLRRHSVRTKVYNPYGDFAGYGIVRSKNSLVLPYYCDRKFYGLLHTLREDRQLRARPRKLPAQHQVAFPFAVLFQ
jgi:diketogulonate reductase-like aldo/keto reductase